MHSAHIKLRLTVMNFLQFAIWGAYLTSMGRYLGDAGFAEGIGNFYAVQGIVSLFMPALMGIVADRWIPAQRLLGLCHALAGGLMLALFAYSLTEAPSYSVLFSIYTLSVAFYMPTLALSNSVAYTSLEQAGLDLVKSFPPIRVFGTVGFICTMITVSLIGVEATSGQFAISGGIGLLLALYAQTLPHCPTAPKGEGKGLVEALGLKAFALFKERKMALFFVFSMFLGVSLQITNGFANPFISSFGEIPAYAETFGVKHANILISLSQLSETLCILLIPFALRRFGIKIVMLIAMLAWVLRFAFLGLGDPGAGVWLFLLSMVVYGVAFDFFNVSGSLFVDKETDPTIRSSAQGLFMIMTNGIGATLGSLGAQAVISHFVYSEHDVHARLAGWSLSWYLFAAYAAIVAVLFAVLFRYRADRAR
ncbi:MFS transporter [uncultured Porphyromonas sp.]|uniref:MFS transporter n=1 Tax=uncultured Porphyromonas sp. TaxID=159274 RepID=UPI00262D6AF8|nr:MFS transporter [uncultured Porphyromonas sp.]